jgi:hypothetical protein
MKCFVLPLLLVSLGCTSKESSPTDFWADNGAKRVSVLASKDGRTDPSLSYCQPS